MPWVISNRFSSKIAFKEMKSASKQAISMGQKVLCKTTSQLGTGGVGANSRGDQLPLPETRSALGTWEDVVS